MISLSMIWSRFVNWSRMNWLVNRFWGGSICSMSFVHNFSNVSRVGISCVISYDLGATIRKKYTVLSRGRVSVAFLILAKVYSTVLILYSIFVSVYRRSVSINWALSIGRSWVVWRWWSCCKYNSN